jgi:hypothetical protein
VKKQLFLSVIFILLFGQSICPPQNRSFPFEKEKDQITTWWQQAKQSTFSGAQKIYNVAQSAYQGSRQLFSHGKEKLDEHLKHIEGYELSKEIDNFNENKMSRSGKMKNILKKNLLQNMSNRNRNKYVNELLNFVYSKYKDAGDDLMARSFELYIIKNIENYLRYMFGNKIKEPNFFVKKLIEFAHNKNDDKFLKFIDDYIENVFGEKFQDLDFSRDEMLELYNIKFAPYIAIPKEPTFKEFYDVTPKIDKDMSQWGDLSELEVFNAIIEKINIMCDRIKALSPKTEFGQFFKANEYLVRLLQELIKKDIFINVETQNKLKRFSNKIKTVVTSNKPINNKKSLKSLKDTSFLIKVQVKRMFFNDDPNEKYIDILPRIIRHRLADQDDIMKLNFKWAKKSVDYLSKLDYSQKIRELLTKEVDLIMRITKALLDKITENEDKKIAIKVLYNDLNFILETKPLNAILQKIKDDIDKIYKIIMKIE